MASKLHVRKGDEVVVLVGKDRGKRGKIIAVMVKKERVLVEGVNLQKKHVRKNQQHPNGTILEREGPIHVSNVMKSENFDARAARRNPVAPAQA